MDERRIQEKRGEVRQEEKHHLLKDEIHLTFHPRKLVHGVFLLAIIALAFFVGRWSVDTSALPSVETITVEEPLQERSSGGITGFFAGLFFDDEDKEEAVAEEEREDDTDSNDVGETDAEGTTEEATEDETDNQASDDDSNEVTGAATAEEEIIISGNYHKVALAIPRVVTDWRGTWGKIMQVDYTIVNNEEGTIKPSYLVIMAEGYDDRQKEIPLPTSSRIIKAGKSSASLVAIPNGFSYNEATTGDLAAVQLNFILFDVNKKPMASYSKNFDLSP